MRGMELDNPELLELYDEYIRDGGTASLEVFAEKYAPPYRRN